MSDIEERLLTGVMLGLEPDLQRINERACRLQRRRRVMTGCALGVAALTIVAATGVLSPMSQRAVVMAPPTVVGRDSSVPLLGPPPLEETASEARQDAVGVRLDITTPDIGPGEPLGIALTNVGDRPLAYSHDYDILIWAAGGWHEVANVNPLPLVHLAPRETGVHSIRAPLGLLQPTGERTWAPGVYELRYRVEGLVVSGRFRVSASAANATPTADALSTLPPTMGELRTRDPG